MHLKSADNSVMLFANLSHRYVVFTPTLITVFTSNPSETYFGGEWIAVVAAKQPRPQPR